MYTKPLMILFGSRARGTQGASSDVDVGVLAEQPLSVADKAGFAENIARKLNTSPDSIDVVDLRSAPPLLQYQVAQTGRLLSGAEQDFIRFKVLAWKRYLDTAKFRRARESVLKERYTSHAK